MIIIATAQAVTFPSPSLLVCDRRTMVSSDGPSNHVWRSRKARRERRAGPFVTRSPSHEIREQITQMADPIVPLSC